MPVQTESKHSHHPNGFNVTFEKDTKPKFEVMDITPDMAKKILAHRNKNNRPIRYTHLEKLSDAIEKDEWKVTNQGIAFDHDGNLIDGQHRLAAILQTRKTVKMMVATNMDKGIFDVVDTGSKRSTGDALDILGSEHGRIVSAALKIYICYQKFPEKAWSGAAIQQPSTSDVIAIYKDRQDEIEALLSVIKKKHRNFKCFSMSLGLVLSILLLDAGWSDMQIWEFWDCVTLGANLPPDSVVLSFRNQLSDPHFRKRHYGTQRYMLNAFIKCFNSYITNESINKFVAPRHDTKMYKIQKPAKKQSSILEVIKK
jgi:hypothetical protein